MILPLENQDLYLLDIYPIKTTFLFAFFSLEVSETTSPLDYSVLLNNLCLVLLPQMHLLDCDSLPIQSSLHPSRRLKPATSSCTKEDCRRPPLFLPSSSSPPAIPTSSGRQPPLPLTAGRCRLLFLVASTAAKPSSASSSLCHSQAIASRRRHCHTCSCRRPALIILSSPALDHRPVVVANRYPTASTAPQQPPAARLPCGSPRRTPLPLSSSPPAAAPAAITLCATTQAAATVAPSSSPPHRLPPTASSPFSPAASHFLLGRSLLCHCRPFFLSSPPLAAYCLLPFLPAAANWPYPYCRCPQPPPTPSSSPTTSVPSLLFSAHLPPVAA
ncbi:hypothetical protein B296_00030893 [Ensete ventricosum]|uniref:Uncharacterized protein n=1 Tax=Ensete ventricosum TaxID=4639 RepID=A0A426ZI94_ENSVE|nr:hypothetical protein B296_00030893 [Ensete ventricosum]